MKRADLEHILRACKGTTGESEFIVIGSQCILGRHPDAPRVLRQSMEADIYPRFKPELAPLIEGSLGRYSQFDLTFGYHADGVGPDTAKVPPGREGRLIPVCSESHRLVPGAARPRLQQAGRAAAKGSRVRHGPPTAQAGETRPLAIAHREHDGRRPAQ
jgi:hypothetical protein